MTEEKVKNARNFCKEVRELAKKYNVPFFVVSDGASATSNNGCDAVKNARDNHIKWEKNNGYNPDDDWSNNNEFQN
jgi:pyruvate/2-oxoacid:ferredoxin oxidoreductase alpha subunit